MLIFGSSSHFTHMREEPSHAYKKKSEKEEEIYKHLNMCATE